MPTVDLIFFKESNGKVPIEIWLESLPKKVYAKLVKRLELLETYGHNLHRPYADFLRDGIYELRVKHQNVNYRMLYFYHGQGVVVVSHGLTKEKRVPSIEIDRVLRRKAQFERDPNRHTYRR